MEVLLRDAAFQNGNSRDLGSGTDVAAGPLLGLGRGARPADPPAPPDPAAGADSYTRADGSVQLAGQPAPAGGRGGGGTGNGDATTFSSTGATVLAFDGTQNGAAVHDSFTSNASHVDLISSNDIVGGFQVAAQVSAGNGGGGRGGATPAGGNQSVAVVANYGANVVTVNANGEISVIDNGNAVAVQAGNSYTLTGGEQVDIAGDGTVNVTLANAAGGSVTTTLTATGSHVDVSGTAQGLTFEGDILAGATTGGPPGGRGNAAVADAAATTPDLATPSGRGGPPPVDAPPTPNPPPPTTDNLTETVSSTGDPHLRFSEHAGSTSIKAHYDDQTSHVDLASTDAVAGGYRVSTQVTGIHHHVAYNKEVTLSSDFFQDTVVVTKDALRVSDHGQNVTVANGHSFTLADGETISRSKDGKTITVRTAAANGSITTVLRQTKQGVDVVAKGVGVQFDGDIVQHVVNTLA